MKGGGGKKSGTPTAHSPKTIMLFREQIGLSTWVLEKSPINLFRNMILWRIFPRFLPFLQPAPAQLGRPLFCVLSLLLSPAQPSLVRRNNALVLPSIPWSPFLANIRNHEQGIGKKVPQTSSHSCVGRQSDSCSQGIGRGNNVCLFLPPHR